MVFAINLFIPESERSEIFSSNNTALQYLRARGWLEEEKICAFCGYRAQLEKNKRYLNDYIYRCKERACRKITNIFANKYFGQPKIKINDHLFAIYKWIENSYEKDVCRNASISKRTFQKIKQNLNLFINSTYNERRLEMIGGRGVRVQVDETVISHGEIPSNPSTLDDDFPGITWLVGMIEENSNNIKLFIVPDRTAETFKRIFENNIRRETTIITDGHASYPSAVHHVSGIHKVVCHSKGFKNFEGFHTNNIENLWGLLKYEIKKRRGIVSSSLEMFLREFHFRYKYLRSRDSNSIRSIFEAILDFLFSDLTV